MAHEGSTRDSQLDALLADALSLVREGLRMDIAYATEITDDEQIIGVVEGEPDSFGLGPGSRFPLADTYCQRMLSGEIKSVVGDAAADPCLAPLAETAASRIGAYVGVPVVLPGSGRVYGTICCLSHEARPELEERDLRFVRMVARLVASEIERDRGEALRLNEQVVQRLTLAVYHLDGQDLASARERVCEALDCSRSVATELIGEPSPGKLRA